jgi:hypothetical protein
MPLLDSSGNYVTQSVAGTPGFVSLAAVSAVQFGAVLNGIGAHGNHTTQGAGCPCSVGDGVALRQASGFSSR